MAAQAWKFYTAGKKAIANGSATLSNANAYFRLMLVTSASNFATAALVAKGSLTNECAEIAGSYSSSGKALASVVWTNSSTGVKFDAADLVWTASATAIANIKGAVIFHSGGSLVCYASLTSSQFTLAKSNTLTIQFATAGIFTLN